MLDDLKNCLLKLKELETSSENHGRIGIDIIGDSRRNLEKLEKDLESQIEKVKNNISELP